jgi:hypothetical protein
VVTRGNRPPNPPTGLTAAKDQYGNTVLSWVPPNPADPERGDTVGFYRIYRDGTAYEDRYDRTGFSDQLSFIDTSPGDTTHTYYVSTVDNDFGESTLTGPVTQ